MENATIFPSEWGGALGMAQLIYCRCLRFLDILLFKYYLELVDGRQTAVWRPSGRVLKNVAQTARVSRPLQCLIC